MGRQDKRRDYVSILEACYESNELDEAWLSELLLTAGRVLDVGGGLGLSLVREGPSGRAVVLSQGVGRVSDMLRLSWPVIEQADEESYRRFFYPRQPVVLASSLVSSFSAPLRPVFAAMMQHAGASDMLGMLGYPARGWAFAMFVAVGAAPVDGALRETLRRLRIHVEASLRLRMFSSSDSVAVIRPDGRLECVAPQALEGAAQAALGAQAVAIEQVRSTKGRADAHRAVAVWHALVEGRWSLVERVERDGKRYYHAFENAPHVQEHRALSETEALVLRLSLDGLVGKEIAYATGLSQSRISTALAGAAERLGFASREELLRVGASCLQEGEDISSVQLTSAERDVLNLVRQGLSNRAIANARNTSINTVANQLASLLRKTGASSRRGLLVAASKEEREPAP